MSPSRRRFRRAKAADQAWLPAEAVARHESECRPGITGIRNRPNGGLPLRERGRLERRVL